MSPKTITPSKPLTNSQLAQATIAAIVHLEKAIERIDERMQTAEGDEFTRLANALSRAVTALFNGHRTISYLTGSTTPLDEALRELKALAFEED